MSKLAEALRRTRERSQVNFLPTFKFPDGKCDIRILPAAVKAGDDSEEWFLPVGFHYNVEEKRPVFCPFETNWAEDDCPICEMVSELRTNGMNEEAQKVSVRRQFLVRAIVRGEEDKGPQVVRLPSTLFTSIGTVVADTEAFGDLLHPAKGRDIRVTKTGTGLNTSYTAMPLPKPRKIIEDIPALKEMLANLTPIGELVSVDSKEALTKLIQDRLGYTAVDFGDAAGDDDLLNTDDDEDFADFSISDDDDDVPFGKKTVDEDEEEEEDDELDSVSSDDEEEEDDDAWMSDDDDDEEVDVTAMVKKDRAKAQAEADDDDDDLTAELEAALEEADAPVVKKKRGKARVKK